MTINEKQLRNSSYANNLDTEKYEYSVFIKWLNENGYTYTINPADSEKNIHGSDITITKNGYTHEIDLKGCKSQYECVPLSYARSYDGVYWFNPLNRNSKITTDFVWIDEVGNIYSKSFDNILEELDSYRKTRANINRAGHFNKVVLISKDGLIRLKTARRIVSSN